MEGTTEEKCACERVCMEDALVQSTKYFEPTTHQMSCSPNVNKMGKCAVVPQYYTLSSLKQIGAQHIGKHCANKQR